MFSKVKIEKFQQKKRKQKQKLKQTKKTNLEANLKHPIPMKANETLKS